LIYNFIIVLYNILQNRALELEKVDIPPEAIDKCRRDLVRTAIHLCIEKFMDLPIEEGEKIAESWKKMVVLGLGSDNIPSFDNWIEYSNQIKELIKENLSPTYKWLDICHFQLFSVILERVIIVFEINKDGVCIFYLFIP